MAYATTRNRAILWVFWDTGLLVSEVCALNLGDVDLTQSTLHVQGSGSRGRVLPLTLEVQQALTLYLEQYRLRAGKRGTSDPLFLSEQRERLTKNGFTQLFHWLCVRAGLEDRHLTPTMLREMFAIRFLQTGGPPKALRRLLGLAECTPIKRPLGKSIRATRAVSSGISGNTSGCRDIAFSFFALLSAGSSLPVCSFTTFLSFPTNAIRQQSQKMTRTPQLVQGQFRSLRRSSLPDIFLFQKNQG
jgi:hypothetical protein